MKPKKWYKDKSRKEIAGVIAGLYDYFDLYENYGWKLENVRLVVIFLAIITNLYSVKIKNSGSPVSMYN